MPNPGFLQRIALAARIKTVPLSIGSVLVVAAYAYARDTDPDAWRIAVLVVVAAAAHVAGILVSDLFDHRAGTDKLARLDKTAIPTGSLQLEAGTLSVRAVGAVAGSMLLLAALLVALLDAPEAWPWFFAGVTFVWSYAAPPLRLAYVGGGFGELAIAAAYGPLLAGLAAAGLAIPLDATLVLASSVIGVFVATAFASHHLLHHRADRAAAKRTPAVAYGEDGALLFLGLLDLGASAAVLIGIVRDVLPPLAAIALLGAPGVAIALRRAHEDPVAQRILGLIGAHLAAVVFAVGGLTVALALG